MKTWNRWWIPALLVSGVALATGCAQKKNETANPAPASDSPAVVSEHGETEEKVVPAPTVEGIWAQVLEKRSQLNSVVENGQLTEVHHLAFGIRDLVIALEAKKAGLPTADATKLKSLVEHIKASASQLDELGDAGNLTGTRSALAHMNGDLDAIGAMLGEK